MKGIINAFNKFTDKVAEFILSSVQKIKDFIQKRKEEIPVSTEKKPKTIKRTIIKAIVALILIAIIYNDGRKTGFQQGHACGYANGHSDGYRDGQQMIFNTVTLTKNLMNE